MKTVTCLTTACLIGASALSVQAAGFTDTFDSIHPDWATDRYDPAGFNSVFFDGDNRLQITIDDADSSANRPPSFSGTFYNTQGKKRDVAVGTTWTVSGDVYISSDMVSGNNIRRTDLWTRDSNEESSAHYPIFGVVRNDDSDPFNPNAASLTSRWRIWDGQVGWVELAAPVTEGWHNLEIIADGTTFVYKLNGSMVHTDLTASSAGFEDLSTVYVQAYNFGDSDYSVYWDNISAVPEPTSLALLGLTGLAVVRRRRAM